MKISEVMICAMAGEIRDGEMAFHGLASPLVAIAMHLAKKTHAPNMVYSCVAEGVDPRYDKVTPSTGDPSLLKGSVAYLTIPQAFDYAQKGKMDIMFFGGAQIDRHGNTNLSVIGDYEKPKVRLPGGAASAFLCMVAGRTVIWTANHSKRTMVDKVDFITGQGYLDGKIDRKTLGAIGSGPSKVITNMGVFDFQNGEMRVRSIHPGFTLDDVLESTGFELIVPDRVEKTREPTEVELQIIERIDPDHIREKEFG
jgi:glutaconate CoA-transferase subunit B